MEPLHFITKLLDIKDPNINIIDIINMDTHKEIPTSLFISNQTLTRLLIELFIRLLDSKKLLIIVAGLGLRNRDFVYRFLSHRLLTI